jgi:hypothetical protein
MNRPVGVVDFPINFKQCNLCFFLFVRPNNLSLVCLYLALYISFLLFGHFFLKHRDRKHYSIKVVESIQFVCTGNSAISRVLCNANTYRSIHEGLFVNSSPANNKKEIYNAKYRHTRDRLFGLTKRKKHRLHCLKFMGKSTLPHGENCLSF